MPRLVGALLFEERGLRVNDLAHARTPLGAVDDVRFEDREPPAKAVDECVAFRRGRQSLDACEMRARFRKPGRVADELLISTLCPDKPRMVIARGHVRRPEQVFLRLVAGEIVT